ncbi:MCP four helix bundle domain-containing protein [Methylogaea oryzae]|uniref:MCP four helix bundle domain-containing protein n=1 Tax=Methylogaea oryzae TaxID=1295382 RepID=UPI0006D28B3D|nr:MCP four helix bundle domain-containing protein [Methylogaea oryzae]
MTIRNQLALGFSLAILLMVVSVGFGLMRMGDMQVRMDDIVNDKIAKLTAIQNWRSAAQEVNIQIRNSALTTDDAANREAAETITRLRAEQDKQEQFLRDSVKSAEGMALLAKVNDAKVRTRQVNDEAIQLAVANKNEEAARVLSLKGREPYRKWMEAFSEFVKHEQELAKASYETAKQGYEQAVFWVLVLGGISLLVSIAAAVWITRSVMSQLGCEPAEASDYARKIAAGDLSFNVNVSGARKPACWWP